MIKPNFPQRVIYAPRFLYKGLEEEESPSLCGSTVGFLLPPQKNVGSHVCRGGAAEKYTQTKVTVTVKHAASHVAFATFIS